MKPASHFLKPAYWQAIVARGNVLGVPEALSRSIAAYVAHGETPGFLLRGVLMGDIEATLARLGIDTVRTLPIGPLILLVREIVPATMRGSREAVVCHLANHARRRMEG